MESINIHEITVNKETMQIVSADAAFYSFVGDRTYASFEKFVIEEDKEVFHQHFKKCSGERFMMRLIWENGSQGCYFSRIMKGSSEESVEILLLYAEELVEVRHRLQKTVSIRNAILELYNDTYFEYEPKGDSIRIYTMERGEQNVEKFSLDEFERRLTAHADEKQKSDVRELILNIRLGTHRFEMRTDKNLLDENNADCLMMISVKSIYEKGIFFMAVGSIHTGREFIQDVQKKVEPDSLTGLIAKADITRMAMDLINVRRVKDITLAIVDIDYFKKVNDTYGHMYGDEVILKVAGIMEKEVGDTGIVGRIGGDEFMIIFYNAADMEYMRERLKCIKNNVKAAFPAGVEGQPAVTLSMGCAAYPKDADNYEGVFFLADFALYRAKEKGRDRYIIFDKEKHGDPEEIRNMKESHNRIDSRGNMTMGDVLCVMMDTVYGREEYPIERLLDDFVINFGIQRLMIYVGIPYHVTWIAGEQRPSAELIDETEHYISADGYVQKFDGDGIFLMNNIKFLEGELPEAYSALKKLGIKSLIQVKFTDKTGNPAILSLESVKSVITWNRSNLHYYRLFAGMLSDYELIKH